MLSLFLLLACAPLATPYAAPITITTTAASITNYYQDFAACSCDLTPALCDNYCCCDSLCSSASSWAASNLCLTTSSSIQIPCGQASRGFGAFEDLACVYYSNRGTIGYYYQSPAATTSTTPTSNLFSSISTLSVKTAQANLLGSLSLGSSYTPTNQYLKISQSASGYLFLPLPGIGGNCVAGLVNITTSGTFVCKIIPTAENCASLNSPFLATAQTICTNGACTPSTNSYTIPSSQVNDGSACLNLLTSFSLTATLMFSNGAYTLQNATPTAGTVSSATLNTAVSVTVTISIAAPSSSRSGNPGYLQGKSITMTGGIQNILDSTINCQTVTAAASNQQISVPFNVKKTLSCLSAFPCNSSYYIDSLANLTTLTISKYANSTTETITVANAATLGCKAETYTLTILYSVDGWLLDPQYYIVSAALTASPAPNNADPSSKFLKFDWIYVDPATVSAPPQNTFYTYFSYLWTPLKQKFGLS